MTNGNTVALPYQTITPGRGVRNAKRPALRVAEARTSNLDFFRNEIAPPRREVMRVLREGSKRMRTSRMRTPCRRNKATARAEQRKRKSIGARTQNSKLRFNFQIFNHAEGFHLAKAMCQTKSEIQQCRQLEEQDDGKRKSWEQQRETIIIIAGEVKSRAIIRIRI